MRHSLDRTAPPLEGHSLERRACKGAQPLMIVIIRFAANTTAGSCCWCQEGLLALLSRWLGRLLAKQGNGSTILNSLSPLLPFWALLPLSAAEPSSQNPGDDPRRTISPPTLPLPPSSLLRCTRGTPIDWPPSAVPPRLLPPSPPSRSLQPPLHPLSPSLDSCPCSAAPPLPSPQEREQKQAVPHRLH